MTATQFEVLFGIVSGLVGVIGVYFLAKSNARENARQKQDAIDDAVRAATHSLRERHLLEVQQIRDQLVTANQQILRRDRALERAQARIDELEDELRRAR